MTHDRRRLFVALLGTLALAFAARAELSYKPYYQGLPDYGKTVVFQAEPATAHVELRAAVRRAAIKPASCERWRSETTIAGPHIFKTNVCDAAAYASIERLLGRIAPSLRPERLGFRKLDLDADGEPELLVEYVDLIGEGKDPYVSFWILRYDGARYRPTHAGPFLVGSLRTQMPFGQVTGRQMLFVEHESCTECHPTVYITILDMLRAPDPAAFQFTYADDHKEFDPTIEFVLPGMGHSVDATVETRVAPPSSQGPHLLQQFQFRNGKTEWWIFRCNDLQCDFELIVGQLPSKYRSLWRSARKL